MTERTPAAERLQGQAATRVVVLDTMMPSEHGLALCQYLGSTTAILIILLTAIAEDTDRSVGLEVGADDYVTQPFNPRELLARIESVIRRTQSLPPGREPVREAFDHAHVHNKPCCSTAARGGGTA